MTHRKGLLSMEVRRRRREKRCVKRSKRMWHLITGGPRHHNQETVPDRPDRPRRPRHRQPGTRNSRPARPVPLTGNYCGGSVKHDFRPQSPSTRDCGSAKHDFRPRVPGLGIGQQSHNILSDIGIAIHIHIPTWDSAAPLHGSVVAKRNFSIFVMLLTPLILHTYI